jgi:hypothetical protein
MPEIPRIQPAPAALGSPASPADFGAEQAAATQATGQGVGQVGQMAEALNHADQTARLTQATASAGVKLESLRQQLAMDPDWATHAERYQQASKQILDQTLQESGLQSGQYTTIYRDRMIPLAGRMGIDVRAQARQKQIDGARANMETAAQQTARNMVNALDPSVSQTAHDQFFDALEEQVRSGLYTREQASSLGRRLNWMVDRGNIQKALNEDPQTALRRLRDSDDPLGKSLPPAELEQRIRTATVRIYRDQALQRREITFQERETQRAQKEQSDAASRDIDDAIAGGDIGKAGAILDQARDVMPPTRYAKYRDEIRSGHGPIAPVRNDPATYVGISNRIANGEDVKDALDTATTQNKLTTGTYQQLLRESRDTRFRSVDVRLTNELAAMARVAYGNGGPAGNRRRSAALALGAELKSTWYDAKRDNPRMSAQEAQQKEAELVQGLANRLGIPEWPPKLAPRNPPAGAPAGTAPPAQSPGGAAAPPAASPAAAAPGAAQGAQVHIRAPDGSVGWVPASALQGALKAGATLMQE